MGASQTDATMLAARIHRLGSPDAVRLDSVPRPTPRPGELLVAVHAAAVNFPDTLMIEGRYQTTTPLPFVPGHEAAGVVAGLGEGVTGWSIGERVAVLASGAFAQYVAAPAAAAVRIPETTSFAEAASTWVCHLTAYHALHSVADIRPGETVLVLGAGGGVGLAAVELAGLAGATVVAAASSGSKLAAASTRGAGHLVGYAAGDLRGGLRDAIGPGAVDVVLDPVGGELAEQALREMRWGGRFVTLGYASGEIPRIPLNLVLLKGVTIKGLEVRTYDQHDPVSAARDRAEFTELWSASGVHPVVGAVFDFKRTGEALTYVAERRAVGKTVIVVRPE